MPTANSPAYRPGLVDLKAGTISREIFVNEAVYREELERVFARAWLFVGHESQIPGPGDYVVSGMGRVGMWRGGGRPGMSVSAPFVWRCLSGSTIAPFPHPSHRTGHADFPASGSRTRHHAFAHGTSRPSRVRRTSPKVS